MSIQCHCARVHGQTLIRTPSASNHACSFELPLCSRQARRPELPPISPHSVLSYCVPSGCHHAVACAIQCTSSGRQWPGSMRTSADFSPATDGPADFLRTSAVGIHRLNRGTREFSPRCVVAGSALSPSFAWWGVVRRYQSLSKYVFWGGSPDYST